MDADALLRALGIRVVLGINAALYNFGHQQISPFYESFILTTSNFVKFVKFVILSTFGRKLRSVCL